MNLTKTLSPFVCLGYIFAVKGPQITRSWKKLWRNRQIYHDLLLLRGSKSFIAKRKHNFYTIQIFFIVNIYFCVAIASKKAINGGVSVSVLVSSQNDQKMDNFGFK